MPVVVPVPVPDCTIGKGNRELFLHWRSLGTRVHCVQAAADYDKRCSFLGICTRQQVFLCSKPRDCVCERGKPSRKEPVTLYFTASGHISGVGTTIFGSVESSLLKSGYFIQTGASTFKIAVAFRNSSLMCIADVPPLLALLATVW